MNLSLFDGNDIPHALTWSDTVYYPSDGTSLLNISASGSGQYVLRGDTCNPPVYTVSISGLIPHYMGYTTSGGKRIYYVGSDSFFDYQHRSYEGTWHAGQYRQMQATFTAGARAALVALVNYSISQLGLFATCSGQQANDLTGRVRVEYALNNPAGDFDQLSFAFSSDGGASWNVNPNADCLSGDSDMTDIVSGHYALVWDATQQLPANTFNSNYRVRLTATAGGVSITSISAPFTIDLRGLQGGLSVAGKVRNAATGQALGGADVSLAGQAATTASDGSYSFSNVALANGNTITASRSGFATYSGTISAPAGGIQSVPRDISLQPASGSKPVVTGVRAKYDGLFLSGVSLANEYTASVDWRGQTPSKVHFYWGRTPPQHVAVNTASGQATAPINMGLGFAGTFTLGDNKLTIQAEDSTGQLSEAFVQNISIIPMPMLLADQAIANFFTFIPGSRPALSWEFQFDPPDAVVSIPFIQRIGPDFGIEFAFDYSLLDGEWGLFAGGNWGDRAHGRRGRRPNAPKFFLGNVDVDFALGAKAEGVASQTRGIVIDRVGVEMNAGARLEILAVYFTDYVPGGQIIRILDLLKGIGIDINSIQKVTVYGKLDASLNALWKPQSWEFESANAVLKPGIEAMYQPNIGIAQGEIGIGGAVGVTTELAPVFGIKNVDGEVYMKIKFVVFGIKQMDERFLILNGTIYERPAAMGLMSATALSEGEPLPGYEGWMVYRVNAESSPTMDRSYLKRGVETFALASSSARSKSILSTSGGLLSPLDAFRLMKQSPAAKGGVAPLAMGGSQPPQLMQAELPIIVNAFPHSEPTLAGYGQELMLLWVADNGNASDLQYADIHWSRFDGADWTAPAAIITDTRADFAPKVAFDGNGDAVAVWQKVTDPNFANADLSAMAGEMEIVWSRWDRASGTWSAPAALTSNAYYDGSPLLAGPINNGDLLLAWTRNEASLLMGTGVVGAVENDIVLGARWSAATKEWGEPEVIVSNLAYRLSQSFAGVSNRAVYAWTTDADGDLSDDSDQEVYYRFWQDGDWQTASRLTADAVPDKNVRAAVSPTTETSPVMPATEGFETGDFSKWPWTFEGNAAWSVQGSTVHEGSFASASGVIGHNGSSTMKVVVNCAAGNVSFAYRVSSEGGYDFLRFYIDGVQQGAWSGSAGWSVASYPITAGQHTLQWSYTKDGSVVSGSDKAWIDSISIPMREPRGVHLVWQRGDDLVSDLDFANDPRVVRPDSGSAGFADYALTYGPNGNMVLLWQEMTDAGSDAHYSVYDPVSDTWSKDATLFNDASLERSFAPVWDSAGQLNFAYNKVELILTNEVVEIEGGGSVTVSNVLQQGRVDVAVAVRRLITDVAIVPGGFTVEGANYLPGDALTLSASLVNAGDVAVSNAAVAFYEGNPADGGVLITNMTWAGWLEGAATNAILSTVWVVPEPATNRTLYAVANADQAFSEFTFNNNTQAVHIGGVDLAVSMVAAAAETDGSMRVIAQVQNIGAPGATNTTLALRRQGDSGAPLATVEVPALDPGLLAQVGFDLPPGTQPEGEAFYTLNADYDGTLEEAELGNNAASFAVNLWLDADGDGIPNWWEDDYFGGPTAADAGALAANGVNTLLQAFIAGLDPHDPDAFLRVEALATMGADPATGGFQISWGSVDKKFYRIERASSLVEGVGFVPIQRNILATPPVNTYRDVSVAGDPGPFFYRVVVE